MYGTFRRVVLQTYAQVGYSSFYWHYTLDYTSAPHYNRLTSSYNEE